MVASAKSIEAMYKVMRKHLDDRTINKIIHDLQKIKGSRSFEETIVALTKCHIDHLTNSAA